MAETIGQQLRQARQRRNLTLEQVAHATHVRVHYLQALESDDLAAVPSAAQARGFLRIYAGYLGLEIPTSPTPLAPSIQPAPSAPPRAAETPAEIPDRVHAEIFVVVGEQLRQQREVLGLSLEDVERHTHLRTFYLRALEAGDLDRLPSPVQGRGMLSNYAEFLGMNPEPLLLKFAEGLQRRLAVRQEQARQGQSRPREERLPAKPPTVLQRFFSREFLLGSAIVVFLVGFAVWASVRIFTLRSQEQPEPTAPPIAAVLLATPSVAPSATPLPPTPTRPAPLPVQVETTPGGSVEVPPPAQGGIVQVYISVRQRAWIRVLVDGKIEFDGRVIPGSAYQYAGDDKVEILTGNGAAIQVFFNQFDLGPMGLFGEVVHQVYTQQGVETPTPTITLTPTDTERPTRTPRGTAQGTPLP
jgi:cytoskeletal protein RodZ